MSKNRKLTLYISQSPLNVNSILKFCHIIFCYRITYIENHFFWRFKMSFYINNNNNCRPGGLCGNPTNGLCEKALIEVTKVFDACRQQIVESGLALTLSDFNPANPTLPLTFISATTSLTDPATISDVVVDRIEQRPNFANVSGTVTIPIIVQYRDANGVLGTAKSTITVPENVILFVPQPSVTPLDISVFATFTSTIGSINEEGTVATVTGCLNIIIKVTAQVDILVPSYGYPVIPPCQQAETQVCPGPGELPLFPTALG